MKILLTNDDGFDAPGIRALADVAAAFGDVTVVAPDRHLSGCGHQVTLGRKLNLTNIESNWYHLDGMPADCVRIGVSAFGPFDWVFSGINQGANLGVDITISGTAAAAREASQLRIPAIAFSQYRKKMSADSEWQLSAHYARNIIEQILENPGEPNTFWNVNFPDTPSMSPETIECPVDTIALPMNYSQEGTHFQFCGDYHEREFLTGTDVENCFSGKITISRV